ncbi:ribonuclease inhibitor-like [Odontesthes bonariensis]
MQLNAGSEMLSVCTLSDEGCAALSSALSSQSSSLTELDLSNSNLQQDSGVKLLSGLQSPTCGLETLSLSGCLITEEGCASLAEAVTSNPSHLRELDLSYNHPGASGEKLLRAALKDPHKLRSLFPLLTAPTLVGHEQQIFVEEVSKENICRNNSEKCLLVL